MKEGLIALICGMGIVFLVLIIISAIIGLLKRVNKSKQEEVKAVDKIPTEISQEDEEEDEEDDMELVAVITSAIASSLNTTTDQLVVRSFRRVGHTQSKWNMTARSDATRSMY